MHLYEPEILIAFVLENLGEQGNFVIIIEVLLDATYDGAGPFND